MLVIRRQSRASETSLTPRLYLLSLGEAIWQRRTGTAGVGQTAQRLRKYLAIHIGGQEPTNDFRGLSNNWELRSGILEHRRRRYPARMLGQHFKSGDGCPSS
jgi:hypothetical protein